MASNSEMQQEEKERKNKRKLWGHRAWRVINWGLVMWLANSALWKLQERLEMENVTRMRIVFFMASLCVAIIMVVFAEGTSHDLLRRRFAQVIAIVSEAVMLLPFIKDTILIVLMDVVNLVTKLFGGKIFDVEQYTDSALGTFWIGNLIITVIVCVSALKEEQSTDKNLGFARTPQKREVTDVVKDGEVVWSFEKYKR